MPASGGAAAPIAPTDTVGGVAPSSPVAEAAVGVPRGELDVEAPRKYYPWEYAPAQVPEPVVAEPAVPPQEAFHLNPAANFETRQEAAPDVEERVPLPAWRHGIQGFQAVYNAI
eukprot:15458966-Alexandrium_andersonii.AAC.1